jgi:uncharacterized integral membrane protein
MRRSVEPLPEEPPPDEEGREAQADRGVRRTTAGRIWTTVVFGTLILVAVLMLILQNGEQVTLDWGVWEFRAALGAAVLLGAVAGSVLVLLAGGLRIVQLRLAARRQARATRRS